VHAWAGVAVLSIEEPGGHWRLATQQGAEAPRPLSGIAAGSYPFDANIGPGPSGSPLIVFARCAGASTDRGFGEPLPQHCRLMRTTPAGSVETPIGAMASLGGRIHAPAVWGNRLAFALPAPKGSDWVYVVGLEAGKRVRPLRVRSAPRPECIEPESHCQAASVHPTVTELSLRGSTLAENIRLGFVDGMEFCPRTEVRLVDLAHHRGEQVEQVICREGGYTLLGVSLTATHLLYVSECGGSDQNICDYVKTRVYRYGLRNHRRELAPEHELVAGFAALDDTHAVEVAAPEEVGSSRISASENNCTRNDPTRVPCQLVRVGPLRFKPLTAYRFSTSARAVARTGGAASMVLFGEASTALRVLEPDQREAVASDLPDLRPGSLLDPAAASS
jgi:hypothetical protein